jgi:hypothetical protein
MVRIFSQIRKPYCLDVEGGSMKNGAPLIMYPCHSGPNQKFAYNRKTRQLKNKMSLKCVEANQKRGLVQNKCSSNKRTQQWRKTKKHYVSLTNKRMKI